MVRDPYRPGHLQILIFLRLAIAGHLAPFIARTRKPWPSAILFWSAILTKTAAVLFVAYPMGLLPSITWSEGRCNIGIWVFIAKPAP